MKKNEVPKTLTDKKFEEKQPFPGKLDTAFLKVAIEVKTHPHREDSQDLRERK